MNMFSGAISRNTGEILNCYLNNAFMCAETKLRAVDSSVL